MKVLKPVEFSRKCHGCQSVITLAAEEMEWKKTNSVHCPTCGETVFFTDSYGSLDVGVKVEYGLVPVVMEKKSPYERELF